MDKYISGHTGKIEIQTEKQARWIAKHNRFGISMRVYRCTAGTGRAHWHVTRMSKGRYYTSKVRGRRRVHRAFNLPE